ncbi:MAG: tRNA (guanosine(46)-N7)-methyltransferase TrmB [Treponema sp.]|jgi:tRNA (guanine-N7-)-methyltransferase|nr:tRNA (guanosine(46)-N7)-methyltransferase TrmB [Treponema sp.]
MPGPETESDIKMSFMRDIKSFVLRSGRITEAQKRSLEKFSPFFCIPFSESPPDFTRVFGNSNPLTVEIGFGMGIATARIAAANPEINYLGIEVFRAGVGRLLWEIERRNLQNVRIIEHDAVEVLSKMIPSSSVAAFHIFFPDPWPKKRHQKRRLIKRPFTGLLTEKLKARGYIYTVSDWEDYALRALAELSATPGLRNNFDGFAPAQAWRPRTKFEEKGLLKGHEVRELFFVKD